MPEEGPITCVVNKMILGLKWQRVELNRHVIHSGSLRADHHCSTCTVHVWTTANKANQAFYF